MTKLDKIEQDIATLSKADLKKLSKWLEEFNADLWDRQIEDDAAAGKLDALISAAKAQAAAGKVRSL
jgi:flagellar motility protein MotE (MotC chaperone)